MIGGIFILNYVYLGLMLIATIFFTGLMVIIIRKFFKTIKSFVKLIADNSSRVQEAYNLAITDLFKYRMLKKTNILREIFFNSTDQMQRSLSHFGFVSKRWLGIRFGIVSSLLIITGYILCFLYVKVFSNLIRLTNLEIALAFTWSLKIASYSRTLFNRMA